MTSATKKNRIAVFAKIDGTSVTIELGPISYNGAYRYAKVNAEPASIVAVAIYCEKRATVEYMYIKQKTRLIDVTDTLGAVGFLAAHRPTFREVPTKTHQPALID